MTRSFRYDRRDCDLCLTTYVPDGSPYSQELCPVHASKKLASLPKVVEVPQTRTPVQQKFYEAEIVRIAEIKKAASMLYEMLIGVDGESAAMGAIGCDENTPPDAAWKELQNIWKLRTTLSYFV